MGVWSVRIGLVLVLLAGLAWTYRGELGIRAIGILVDQAGISEEIDGILKGSQWQT